MDAAPDHGEALFTVRIPARALALQAGGRPGRVDPAPLAEPMHLQPAEPTSEEAGSTPGSDERSSTGDGSVDEKGAARVLVMEDVPDLRRVLCRDLPVLVLSPGR